jgi:hypothetical protein
MALVHTRGDPCGSRYDTMTPEQISHAVPRADPLDYSKRFRLFSGVTPGRNNFELFGLIFSREGQYISWKLAVGDARAARNGVCSAAAGQTLGAVEFAGSTVENAPLRSLKASSGTAVEDHSCTPFCIVIKPHCGSAPGCRNALGVARAQCTWYVQ